MVVGSDRGLQVALKNGHVTVVIIEDDSRFRLYPADESESFNLLEEHRVKVY